MPVRSILSLARSLGPWTREDAVAQGVDRQTIDLFAGEDERPMQAWVYRPTHRPPRGTYVVAHGLHFAGPADPRMDRFLRALARAGLLVVCPCLPDFLDLRVRPTVLRDFARGFDAAWELPDRPPGRPGVFSISFGSLPALRLASDPKYAARVSDVVLFGGFADFRQVVQFALNGDGRAEHDPLNRPVVLMNVLDNVPELPEELGDVIAAWTGYVRATWGRSELKEDGAWQRAAEDHGRALDGPALALYRVGTGLDPGALEMCVDALDRFGPERAFLDPRPYLAGLKARVHVIHGADDDVIPWGQLDALLAAMPAHVTARGYLTGLYAHSHASAFGGLARGVAEAATLGRMLVAISSGGRRR